MLRTRNNTVETLFSWSYINKSWAHKTPGAITCALACGCLAKPGYHNAKVVITRVSYVHEHVPRGPYTSYLGWLSLFWGHCSSLGMALQLRRQHWYTASCGRAAGQRGGSPTARCGGGVSRVHSDATPPSPEAITACPLCAGQPLLPSAASALASLQPWGNCCKVQDAHAKVGFGVYCPCQGDPVRKKSYTDCGLWLMRHKSSGECLITFTLKVSKQLRTCDVKVDTKPVWLARPITEEHDWEETSCLCTLVP